MTRAMGKRILLTVDGSDHSLKTAGYVGRMLNAPDMSLVIFHALHKIPDVFWDLEANPHIRSAQRIAKSWEVSQQDKLTAYLAKVKQILTAEGFPEKAISQKIWQVQEGIARDIVAEAGHGYAAVAMGRKGLGLLELLLGGIASKLLNKLVDVPVILVGGDQPNKNVLVAVDGSEGAKRAVEFAGTMLRSTECNLTLFHSIRTLGGLAPGKENTFNLNEEESAWVEDHMKYMRHYLQEAREKLLGQGFSEEQVEVKVVTEVQSRAGSIINEARKGDYQTIVVGRRGFSEVREHNMGRVSNKVIQLAGDKTVWLVN